MKNSMDWDNVNAGRQELLALLERSDAPGPACATALDQAAANDWTPETTPWLSGDEQQRQAAIKTIQQAYNAACEGRSTKDAAKVARTVASDMTTGAAAYISKRYLATAEKPARHRESFIRLMTLASDMPTEETPRINEKIARGLAGSEWDCPDTGIGLLRRRISHAEEAMHTGQVIYTDSTAPGLAKRIEQMKYERGRLLVSDVESEVRRRLPGHLGNRTGLKLWDLYGFPAAIAVYAQARDEFELEADQATVDELVAAMPWPTPAGSFAWKPREILQELLRLHQRGVIQGHKWDGTIDFSF